jgi:predicted N-acetyltransferase YhbS
MKAVQVRDMTQADEYFVSTCSHVNESDEIDACGRARLAWLRSMQEKGLRTKVALLDGEHAGFVYLMPIEASPWGPLGRELMFVPCLWVLPKVKGKGIGRALIAAAQEETKCQGQKGIVTRGFHHDFWFMPAGFFEKIGYEAARVRQKEVILWKRFDPSAEAPTFLQSNYRYVPVPGRVVVDLFWHTFCETSCIEAQRVREVAAEFGDAVVLNEYCADDREVLLRYQNPRAIFINGKEIGWGYAAPKEGIAEAIAQALKPV